MDFGPRVMAVAEGPAGVLVALRPEMDDGIVRWYDGVRFRMFALDSVLENSTDRFRFRDARDRTFTLTPMTPATYAAKIQPQTGGPVLASMEALERFWFQRPAR